MWIDNLLPKGYSDPKFAPHNEHPDSFCFQCPIRSRLRRILAGGNYPQLGFGEFCPCRDAWSVTDGIVDSAFIDEPDGGGADFAVDIEPSCDFEFREPDGRDGVFR